MTHQDVMEIHESSTEGPRGWVWGKRHSSLYNILGAREKCLVTIFTDCNLLFCRCNKCWGLSLDPLSKTGTGMNLSGETNFPCITYVHFTPPVEVLGPGSSWSQVLG